MAITSNNHDLTRVEKCIAIGPSRGDYVAAVRDTADNGSCFGHSEGNGFLRAARNITSRASRQTVVICPLPFQHIPALAITGHGPDGLWFKTLLGKIGCVGLYETKANEKLTEGWPVPWMFCSTSWPPQFRGAQPGAGAESDQSCKKVAHDRTTYFMIAPFHFH